MNDTEMEGPFARKFFIPQIEGRIRSYVARELEPLPKLVKYIRTMRRKYRITVQDLQRILTNVKKESVDPFLDHSKGILYQPKRLARLDELCQELGLKVI